MSTKKIQTVYNIKLFMLSALIGAALTMFMISLANADDQINDNLFFKLGGSLNYDSIATNKVISSGYQADLIGPFQYQLEGGYFVDNTSLNRGQTLFMGPSLGVAVNKPSYYTKVFFGPAYITHEDMRLSTPFEFNTDLEIGLRDERNVGVGFGYKHMSNGGTGGSNLGRDFIYVKIQLR